MTRKQRVTRVVYGIYVVIVAAFTVSNIAQVGRQIFGPNGGAARPDAAKVTEPCERQLKEQFDEIERARAEASTAPSRDEARARYTRSRESKRTPELERACASDPNGAEALAALARFDRAAGDHAVQNASDLSPVRLSFLSFISGHPQ